MSLSDILGILSGLVLFLYGIQALGDNLKKVSGGKMASILQGLTSNKWKGALLGALVTAVIQSSGATIVMVVGFVNSEIMSLRQAVGVILGANIGTTITAWLLSTIGIQSDNIVMQMLKPANFSPIVGIVGIIMMMFCKKQKKQQVGAILTSFAALMIGMDMMSSSATPLASNPSFTGLLTMFSNPFLGLLVGLVVTVILQSSSASVGILQAISLTGTLQMGSAIPVLMGENIGSAITGILGAIGASRNARRASFLQLFYCIIKTTVFMAGFYSLNYFLHFPIMTAVATPVSIAVFHSVFNIVAMAVVLPFSDFLVKLVEKAVPFTAEEEETRKHRRALQILDARFVTSPTYALEQCKSVMNMVADLTQEAVETAVDLIVDYDADKARHVKKLENTVDEYEDQLNSYLVRMRGLNFSAADSHLFTLLIRCIGDFERMTDHALNIQESAALMEEKGQHFSEEAKTELQIYNAALKDIVVRSMKAFRDMDLDMASTVEPLEELIDDLNMEIKRRHVHRVRRGICSIEVGISLEDISTDFERISDHCNNIAIYLSQSQGEAFQMHTKKREAESTQTFAQQVEAYEHLYTLPALDSMEA